MTVLDWLIVSYMRSGRFMSEPAYQRGAATEMLCQLESILESVDPESYADTQ